MTKLPALLLALLSLPPAALAAQQSALSMDAAARGADSRSQVAVEIGYLSAGLSYARRLGEGPLSAGVGVWGAWEPPGTFDRNVWEPLGVVVFGRWRAAPWLHADLGLTGARYQWADDCSSCSGSFFGLRSAVLVGHRFVFVGPELSAGWASDSEHGSEFGLLWGGQVRFVFGWGP
jgi:hypothetical protein